MSKSWKSLGVLLPVAIMLYLMACQPGDTAKVTSDNTNKRVDSVLQLMTLDEKIGQLNHLKGNYTTDIYEQHLDLDSVIVHGQVGALTPFTEMRDLIHWQKLAVDESRLGIPLLYAADVIHGYKTIFPVPLGQAASWDMEAIRKAERIAAKEMTAAGFNWTLAPMLDVTREPRWGRVMEGPGEDPYLASEIAKARVEGFQGRNLGLDNTVLACAKHFAAYGAIEGGREYNTVSLSENVLREIYLPPFQAAVAAGVGTVMNAFNTLDGIPASAHRFLIKDILKGEWDFQGFTVSDAHSFYELIPHGVAADKEEAAYLCMQAASDTDLWGQVYSESLEGLVLDGRIQQAQIDDAVRRVLYYKFKLGLFDDPFLYLDSTKGQQQWLTDEHKAAALDLARKSLVLLKNDTQLLPLSDTGQKIGLIGPLANSREYRDIMGNWKAAGDINDVITIYQGLVKKVGSDMVLLAEGCEGFGKCPEDMIRQALTVARQSDVLILALGENGYSSGEAASRANISLPGDQEKLLKAIHALGKPTVLLVFSGRPLLLNWAEENVPSILACWQPGTMAGDAVADVLFGGYNPSGKLPITFPYHLGQVPIYYNQLNTGRPRLGPDDTRWGVSNWSDVPNEPLYPFGFGLSYTTFEYSEIDLDRTVISFDGAINARVTVRNSGKYKGEETVQMYIHDKVASVSRPVKELKGFKKIELGPGESKTVSFKITPEMLKYWNAQVEWVADEGEFDLYVGPNSRDLKKATFVLEK